MTGEPATEWMAGYQHPIAWKQQPLFLSPRNTKFEHRLAVYQEFAGKRTDLLIISNYDGSEVPFDVMHSIGSSRVTYLVGVNGWSMPLNEDLLDITRQDFTPGTVQHVLSCSDGILASCRTIHNPDATRVDDLPFLATNELNGSTLHDNLPTVNQALSMRALHDNAFAKALSTGTVATIERLVPTSLTVAMGEGDTRMAIVIAQACIGSAAIASAAYLRSKGVTHVVIQADERYRGHYQETLGIPEEGIVCSKIHSLADGTPDPCYTMLLDLKMAERYTQQHNPSVYQFYTRELENYQNA